jgi:hypothetical protein
MTKPTEPAADAPVPHAGTELPAGPELDQQQDPEQKKPQAEDSTSMLVSDIVSDVGDVVLGIVTSIFDD